MTTRTKTLDGVEVWGGAAYGADLRPHTVACLARRARAIGCGFRTLVTDDGFVIVVGRKFIINHGAQALYSTVDASPEAEATAVLGGLIMSETRGKAARRAIGRVRQGIFVIAKDTPSLDLDAYGDAE